MRSGFLMSFEAAASLLLLFAATLALPMFSLREAGAQAFFLCSDAALLFAESPGQV